MKITISHDQDSIDPATTYSDEQFPAVQKSLESAYEKAIHAEYPDAEIEFTSPHNPMYGIRVNGTGLDDPSEIEFRLQEITESVFSTGNFWL